MCGPAERFGPSTRGGLAAVLPHGRAAALPALSQCSLLLSMLVEAVPQAGADSMPVMVQSAEEAADPASRWFSNELGLPCAPGWRGFLCNEKMLPEGWVPTDLPPVTEPVRLNPEAIDLVRLNAVQPGIVPPLATGYKVIDLEPGLAKSLKEWSRGNLAAVDNVPQALGQPDRRSRIISRDPDHVFHSRVVQLPSRLKTKISNAFEKLISEWIGQPVVYSAGFGARTYLRNATFAAHVDRYDTHIASAIINLDQQVDEDWPVVICDHEGDAHAVPLHAGQALLYESARLLHSRPHPLQGDFYTNFFIHFRPKYWEAYLSAEDMDGKIAKLKQSWSRKGLEYKVRELERLKEGV